MLKKLKLDEFEKAANLAYLLSLNPSTNSYQLRNSQEEFLELFNKSLKYPDHELLGYFKEDELIAVIYLEVIKKDLYLQTNALFIKDELDTVISEFIKYIRENYSGYEIYIGYPQENEKAINYLLNQGFQIIESSTDMRLIRENFMPSDLKNSIIKINLDNYPEFATFHDRFANDIYWNSTRIKEHFDNWILYSYWSNSQLKASIATKKVKSMIEIFALLIDEDIANNGIEEDLITATLNDGFEDQNVKDVVYFIDANDIKAESYSKKLGFHVYSHYRCLYSKL